MTKLQVRDAFSDATFRETPSLLYMPHSTPIGGKTVVGEARFVFNDQARLRAVALYFTNPGDQVCELIVGEFFSKYGTKFQFQNSTIDARNVLRVWSWEFPSANVGLSINVAPYPCSQLIATYNGKAVPRKDF